MKNASIKNFATKAEKREVKKRPRMKMHGKSLLKNLKYAGEKLAKKR
jgi:hypothetical protein